MTYTHQQLEHLGKLCPECDSTDTESNGSTEYRCIRCDHRWGREYGEAYGYEPPRDDGQTIIDDAQDQLNTYRK